MKGPIIKAVRSARESEALNPLAAEELSNSFKTKARQKLQDGDISRPPPPFTRPSSDCSPHSGGLTLICVLMFEISVSVWGGRPSSGAACWRTGVLQGRIDHFQAAAAEQFESRWFQLRSCPKYCFCRREERSRGRRGCQLERGR